MELLKLQILRGRRLLAAHFLCSSCVVAVFGIFYSLPKKVDAPRPAAPVVQFVPESAPLPATVHEAAPAPQPIESTPYSSPALSPTAKPTPPPQASHKTPEVAPMTHDEKPTTPMQSPAKGMGILPQATGPLLTVITQSVQKISL